MALCRCKYHPPANNRKYTYSQFVKALGYPKTASICGKSGCENPGLIFLTNDENEVDNFNAGERVFYFFRSNETKVEVENKIYTLSQINSVL
jgi:hypothetical protein